MNRYVPAESAKLVFSGEPFFETLEKIIDSAKETIHLQTYIFEEDEIGNRIANALIKAAGRKIAVFVLLDGFGSNSLSGNFINRLISSGINFRFFSPLFSTENIYLGRRLHHKIMVADKKTALVGGINIADKYHGSITDPPWLDFAVSVQGDACIYLHSLCESIFLKKHFGKKKKQALFDRMLKGEYLIRFRRNDWVLKKNEIHHSYREALTKAEKSIFIVASYFLPGYFFRKILKKTSQRGVEITIILTKKSDVGIIRNAERYLYGFLLRNKIKIYEWPNSMMHGKATIVDKDWATIGSYNLNQLSHYRSIELNVDLINKEFAQNFRKHLEVEIIKECVEISDRNFSGSDFFQRVINFLAFYYIRIISTIFFLKKP